MWDLQPTLIGEVVRLEPLAPEHRDALFAVVGTGRDLGVLVVQPRRERGGVRQMVRALPARGGRRRRRALRDRSCRRPARPSAARASAPAREHDRGLEIGWTWLTPAAWGTGANTEAKFLQLRYAFEATRLHPRRVRHLCRERALARGAGEAAGAVRGRLAQLLDPRVRRQQALVRFLLCDRR